ncbi:hypothetical protein HBB16_01425 [Pseudonocardia sp. MCCB 268]|nr:hypothetical protein [Pseudonocardia cytotoxica]
MGAAHGFLRSSGFAIANAQYRWPWSLTTSSANFRLPAGTHRFERRGRPSSPSKVDCACADGRPLAGGAVDSVCSRSV